MTLLRHEGTTDWNNEHPWDSRKKTPVGQKIEWWGENEWQETGDGGQIPIHSWTRWNDNRQESKSVAYGWGCWDSVEGFNKELKAQSAQMKAYREGREEKNKKYRELDTNWDESQMTAPGGQWANYLFKERSSKTDKQTISTNTADVSVPGLSTYWDENNQFVAGKHEYDTSGIDCSGLVHLAAVYSGNGYELPNKASESPGKTVNTSGFASDMYTQKLYTDMWMLDIKDDNPDDTKKTTRDSQREILSHAVPGDILVVADSHVVIINDIRLTQENGKVFVKNYADVDVIHSTSGGLNEPYGWNVQTGSWFDLGTGQKTAKHFYELRRLKK